jgi:hypothetical protein
MELCETSISRLKIFGVTPFSRVISDFSRIIPPRHSVKPRVKNLEIYQNDPKKKFKTVLAHHI